MISSARRSGASSRVLEREADRGDQARVLELARREVDVDAIGAGLSSRLLPRAGLRGTPRRSTHSPIGMISPFSSAIGMNSAARSAPHRVDPAKQRLHRHDPGSRDVDDRLVVERRARPARSRPRRSASSSSRSVGAWSSAARTSGAVLAGRLGARTSRGRRRGACPRPGSGRRMPCAIPMLAPRSGPAVGDRTARRGLRSAAGPLSGRRPRRRHRAGSRTRRRRAGRPCPRAGCSWLGARRSREQSSLEVAEASR